MKNVMISLKYDMSIVIFNEIILFKEIIGNVLELGILKKMMMNISIEIT